MHLYFDIWIHNKLWDLQTRCYRHKNYILANCINGIRMLLKGYHKTYRHYPTPWANYLTLSVEAKAISARVVWQDDKFRLSTDHLDPPVPKLPITYVYDKVKVFGNIQLNMPVGYFDTEGNVVDNVVDLEEIELKVLSQLSGDNEDANVLIGRYARIMAERNYDRLPLNKTLRQRNEHDTV